MTEDTGKPLPDVAGFQVFGRGRFWVFANTGGQKRIEELVARVNAVMSKKPAKHKTAEKPNRDETIIIEAINEDQHGRGFCLCLDQAQPPVGPRPSWQDIRRKDYRPWPSSYLLAYTRGKPEVRNAWRDKIYGYRNDVKNKYSHLIKKKHLPTCQGK